MPRYLSDFCLPLRLSLPGGAYLLMLLLVALSLSGCASESTAAKKALYPGGIPFAVEPHLKIQWRHGINAPDIWTFRPREFSSPTYRKQTDEIFVGTDAGTVVKVRGGDGQILWETKLNGPVHAGVEYGAGRVYVGTLGGKFYALNEATGAVEWVVDASGSIETRASFEDGRVFYTTGEDILTSVDAATGKPLWTYQRAMPEYFTIKGSGSPLVHDGIVYCGFADGVLAALQMDTGEMIWESNLGGAKTEFVDVDNRPVLVGEHLFAASYDGGVYALDKMTGDPVWQRKLTGVTDIVYGETRVYVATARGRVIALGAEDGEPVWSFKFEEAAPVAMTATQLYLFISTASGPLYTLDRITGTPLMSWNPSNGFNTRLALGQSRGYLFSNGGYLYGFDIAF